MPRRPILSAAERESLLALAAHALETLRNDQVILPAITVIERVCGEAITRATRRIHRILELAVAWLEQQRSNSRNERRFTDLLRHTRAQALLLVGFWHGFRSDELIRLQIDRITAVSGEGMSIHLPRTKTDRGLKGTTYKTPALSRLCPVSAYLDWLAVSGLSSGPVFRSIDRWGRMSPDEINPRSVIPLLRRILKSAGVPDVDDYSSHSL